MTFQEKFKNKDNEIKYEDIFIVRKELIVAVYETISAQDPYI